MTLRRTRFPEPLTLAGNGCSLPAEFCLEESQQTRVHPHTEMAATCKWLWTLQGRICWELLHRCLKSHSSTFFEQFLGAAAGCSETVASCSNNSYICCSLHNNTISHKVVLAAINRNRSRPSSRFLNIVFSDTQICRAYTFPCVQKLGSSSFSPLPEVAPKEIGVNAAKPVIFRKENFSGKWGTRKTRRVPF